MQSKHEFFEKNLHWMIIGIILVVSVAGLVEIVPLFFQKSTTQAAAGVKPYTALQLAGRDVYVREGCYNCHSQMIRNLQGDIERYGPASLAGESVYDRPFQWGSKRTGPDLARVGGRYTDDWHRTHLEDPRSLVPESNMPPYPWLAKAAADSSAIVSKMSALKLLGHPYSDAEIKAAPDELKGKTELDALVAYLQGLGSGYAAAKEAAAQAAAANQK